MPKTTDTHIKSPLYRQIGEKLRGCIERGEYAIGQVLPTEVDLAVELGVSRATLRGAMDILSDLGLVQRTKKLGTTVIRNKATQGYVQQLQDMAGILSFAGDTAMLIHDVRAVTDDEAGHVFGTPSATGLCLSITGTRRLKTEQRLSTWSNVLVDGRYSQIESHMKDEVDSVYEVIERLFPIRISSLRQRISAIRLPAYAASFLGLRAGTPALEVTAWLYDEQERLVEHTRAIHNPELFNVEIRSERIG